MKALERLLQRLPLSHLKIIDIRTQLETISAGFNGETRVDQIMQEIQFDIPFFYFPNFECELSPTRFSQLDSVLLTNRYLLLIEIKNMRGELHFNEQPYQLIQDIEGKKGAYHCPQMQLLRAADTVEHWLNCMELPKLPIYKIIVMPNSRTIIKTAPTKVPLIMSKQVALYIQKLNKLPAVINENQFLELSDAIITGNKPFKQKSLCEKYHIPKEHIKNGVICHCGASGIRISERTWHCPTCKCAIPNAIEQTIQDWFWICGEVVTIKEFMDFLQCNSRNLVARTLNNSNLIALGNTKSRRFLYNHRVPIFNK
ncbi:NERD domain-containing protein [Viridibacillus sp. YIM B01967]|uniref:NERD domain-containing protein n=1 Tax=Viridibacillus soli TaxID=2798301 RepID=A0ABS1H2T4_9BACL|nr:nuclease-related domain-containing protein [Viridibacillus soli]MBK3493735.1 NERD domain-containing protein [Viridibacillus soli]